MKECQNSWTDGTKNLLANKYHHFDEYLQKTPVPVFHADSLSDIKLWRVGTWQVRV